MGSVFLTQLPQNTDGDLVNLYKMVCCIFYVMLCYFIWFGLVLFCLEL